MRLCPTCGAAYREPAQRCPRDGARLADAHDVDPRLGSQVGNYRLVDLVGKGAMGVVYKAQHLFIPKTVAIKILHDRFKSEPELVTRFFQEALAAATIGQPNICEVQDVGELPDGTPYFVAEFVDGRPLDQVIAEEAPLALSRAIAIVGQIAEGLAAAHDKGIIHRDLKPANVMLVRKPGGGEHVEILDFGLAKMTTPVQGHETRPGMLIGTPAYMAPEACSGKPVDHRADVYALGVIFYELLSGSLPFVARTVEEVLRAHVQRTVPPLRRPGVEVTDAAEDLVMRCLAKNAGARPRSMRALLGELEACSEVARQRRAIKPIVFGSAEAREVEERMSGVKDTLPVQPQFQQTLKGVGEPPKKNKPR